MTDVPGFRTDRDLLTLAGRLLTDAGFAQEETVVSDSIVLLSENEYCIVALTATPTLDELVSAEPQVANLLHERLHGADVGPKLWDAYVVLLTQERPPDHGTGLHPLFTLAYDMRGFRRIARVGIEPTLQGARSALTPFVAPLRLHGTGLATPPLLALSSALVTRGVDEGLAKRAIKIHRSGGHLDDVF